jgi:Skp family chaperone for outer membrane proteins
MNKRAMSAKMWVFVLLPLLFFLWSSALAKKVVMWKYVDDKGIAHYVDEYYKIPDKYKSKAVKVEVEVVEPQEPGGPPPSPPSEAPKQEEVKKKEEWQKKARQAVEKVKSLQKAISETEPQCAQLHREWTVMPVQANKEALDNCLNKLEQLKKELKEAIEYRDKGIYKEAMQAGIPIDWIDGILKGTQE